MVVNTSTKKSRVVLVVDDDKYILELVSDILGCVEIGVVKAISGEEALQSLQSMIPDMILLDIHLPGIPGLQILKHLSEHEVYQFIPILVITSDKSKETIDEVYRYNVYDYIEKPINPSLLIKRTQAAFDKKELSDEFSEMEKKLLHVQHIAGLGYWEYDSSTDVLSCSEELHQMMGVGHEQVDFTLYSFLGHIHDDDVDEVSEHIRQAIINGVPYALEHRLYDHDSNEIIVLHQGEVIRDLEEGSYRIISTITDITERRQAQKLVEFTTFYDKLTGLPNRNHFCNKLGALMVENDDNNKLLGLIFIGIDRFKNINDSLGHSVGDEIIVSLGEKLSQLEGTLVARFSGDVFAVAVIDMESVDNVVFSTQKIKQAVSEPFNLCGHDIYMTLSMGVAIYPLHNGDKEQFINNAESAMHYSKNSGGNRISCFETKMITSGKRRLFIESDLRKAIDKEQFEVYYQPQVSVETRRLIGMEALIRWQHPKYGLISPDDFIPIAEETGLILPIGEWVLEQAARQVAQWTESGYGYLRVGVNISPLQFESKSLIKTVEKVLAKTRLPPCCLDLELTESSAMRDLKQTITLLNMLREMDVQTSLDDFGTGYSSLSYLNTMPLHTLKIDRAFVRDINGNGRHGELAKMIISMCHALGLNVIAEGVETEEQMQFLLQNACIEAQGYLFSRPVNSQEFEKILKQYGNTGIAYDRPETQLLIFS